MASVPSEPRAVLGRLDAVGRLIAADPELEALQVEAGAAMGQSLALPQVAAIAELARKLGTTVSRPAVCGSAEQDIDLWVEAIPAGDEIALSLRGWTPRGPAGPRLAMLLGGGADADAADAHFEWSTDENLRIISASQGFADMLGTSVDDLVGQPLTKILRIEEDDAGEMPLIAALASRTGFAGQPARGRSDNGPMIILAGDVVTAADGAFAGFRGTAASHASGSGPSESRNAAFDEALDELLRSPLDRIIETAEHIVERSDGPLRSDYASYGNDIAAAARHLLSVLTAMSAEPGTSSSSIDLANLAAEAAAMLESSAEERRLKIEVNGEGPVHASGEERATIQILVNLIVNAIHYSPEGGTIRVSFGRMDGTAAVTVADEGPGVAEADRERIFERFERAHTTEAGTGLGLAISRRLARNMGGDVSLESVPGEGARFTLTLPAA